MNKKVKYFSFAIAIVAVASIMIVAIYAATTASAGISANVSWTATAGIEFELEAWAVNNASQNGIGNTTTPKSITKQVVTTATTNQSASGLGGDLSCNFYDGSNDGVNNPSSIIFTYKITNTGDTVILIKTTKTPNSDSTSLHNLIVVLNARIDEVSNAVALNKLIGTEGFKIQPNSTFEYVVMLSIEDTEININNFDASVSFSMMVSSGETDLEMNRDTLLYADNGVSFSGTTANGVTNTYTYYGAYPQTYVGDNMNNTLKAALQAGVLLQSGKNYTTDAARDLTNPNEVVLKEYFYQGNFYVYLDSAYYGVYNKFLSGENIERGKDYFFKVEPLKWINYNGTYLCEKSIGSMRFDVAGTDVTWKGSEIREWINEKFYIESGLNLIKTTKTTLHNTYQNTMFKSEDTTEDYVWIPSFEDLESRYENNVDFIADSSDFTRATLSLYNSANHTYYWIRSAPVKSSVAYYITQEGLCNYINCEATAFAIRPCFSL